MSLCGTTEAQVQSNMFLVRLAHAEHAAFLKYLLDYND